MVGPLWFRHCTCGFVSLLMWWYFFVFLITWSENLNMMHGWSLFNCSHERTPMDEAVSRGKMDVIDAINTAVAVLEVNSISVSECLNPLPTNWIKFWNTYIQVFSHLGRISDIEIYVAVWYFLFWNKIGYRQMLHHYCNYANSNSLDHKLTIRFKSSQNKLYVSV